jgi:uncharacterized membrane protein YadS
MKMIRVLALASFLACVNFAQAQTSDANPHRTNTQILDFILNFQEQRIIAVA